MAILDLLFALPLWLLGVLLIASLAGFGLAALWAVRRWVLPRLRLGYPDAYYGAAAVQSAMLLYALVGALIAVGVWQRHSQAGDVVSTEATAIASLWRDLGAYPEPTRGATRAVLRDYTRQIVDEAWPLQRQGRVPTEGVAWMDRLQAHLLAFEPQRDSQRIAHAETLRAFNALVQARRQRLDLVGAALPGVMWLVLLPGAFGCVLLFTLFHVDNARFQALLLVGVAAYLAMVLFVILALDRPLCGQMGIGADSYQLVFDHHMR